MENIINTIATPITENTTLGELLRILSLGEKPHETPTPKMLRETAGEPIAKEERCLVYANGYAVYDNGSGRTVVWLPDCVSFVYYFVKPKESEIGIAPEKFELPENGFTDLYKQQLISLTEFEKMMGKKRFNELLGEFVAKPPGKLTLVPEDDPRPAVDLNNAPDQEFSVLSDE